MKSSRAPLPKARGSVYLFDTKGTLRRVHSGEGEYAETERAIRSLLGRRSFPALCRVSPPVDSKRATFSSQ